MSSDEEMVDAEEVAPKKKTPTKKGKESKKTPTKEGKESVKEKEAVVAPAQSTNRFSSLSGEIQTKRF